VNSSPSFSRAGRCPPTSLAPLLAPLLVAVLGIAAGCATPRSAGNGATTPNGAPTLQTYSKLTRDQCRSELYSISDAYMNLIAQGYDALRAQTTRPAVADWAITNKISSGTAILADATEPNEAVGLIDMAIFSTLQRQALEEHWIPTLLGGEGEPLLEVFRAGESQVWTAAGHAFTQDQLDQLRTIIDVWTQEHPTLFYVDHVRISDVASERRFTADSPQVHSRGSLFGLLYLDPLASLDPVAQELQDYRALTERALFLLARMPTIMGWQADYAASRVTTTPEARSFADSAKRFADTVARYPKELAKEREAAVRQLAAAIATERQAMIDDIDARLEKHENKLVQDIDQQQTKATDLVAQAHQVVLAANKTSLDANTAAQATIAAADQAARRLATLIFIYALLLIVAITAAVCIAPRLRPK